MEICKTDLVCFFLCIFVRIRWASEIKSPDASRGMATGGGGGGGSAQGYATISATAPKSIDETKSVSIYVSFHSACPDLMVNDESLRSLFGCYGALSDVSIKQSVFDRHSQCQKGYAFICFQQADERGVLEAFRAASEMEDVILNGIHYRCEMSKSLRSKLVGSSLNCLTHSQQQANVQASMMQSGMMMMMSRMPPSLSPP
jgi:hypothetical protein